MPFKKRSDPPVFTTKFTEKESEPETDGRSSVLQGLRFDVYQFIKSNSGCTREDVSRGLGLKSSTTTARIKELIDEGFVYEPQGMRKLNKSGVRARVLKITTAKAGAPLLDKVRVEVELAIDCRGNYFIHHAHVVGGVTKPKGYRKVKVQRFTMTAPAVGIPDNPDSVWSGLRVERVSPNDLWDGGEIIEGHVISAKD